LPDAESFTQIGVEIDAGHSASLGAGLPASGLQLGDLRGDLGGDLGRRRAG
jgi:hypothetical protein